MKSLELVNDDSEKNSDSEEFLREQYVVNYLKSLLALEEAMAPYKEQKKELREEYIENGWLSKDEIWAAVGAYRIYMKGADIEEITDMFEAIERVFGTKELNNE
jgi:hypothetical protein